MRNNAEENIYTHIVLLKHLHNIVTRLSNTSLKMEKQVYLYYYYVIYALN